MADRLGAGDVAADDFADRANRYECSEILCE